MKEDYIVAMQSSRPNPVAHYVTPLKKWTEAEEIFKFHLPRLRKKLWDVRGLKIKLTHSLGDFAKANKLKEEDAETHRCYSECRAWAEDKLEEIRKMWLSAPLVRCRQGYSLDLSKIDPKLR